MAAAACSSDETHPDQGGAAGSAATGGAAGGGAGGGAGGQAGSAGSGALGGSSGASGGTGAAAGAGGAGASAGTGGTSGGAGTGAAAGAGGSGAAPPAVVERDYDFTGGLQSWSTGFADYAEGMQDLELASGSANLPAEIGTGKGLMIQGHNRSDDLFMFIKRSLGPEDGIRASVLYRATMRVQFASNAQSGCVGIGGAPGEAVFLKYGTTAQNPVPVLLGGVWRMNVDKGDQGTAGPVGTLAGDLANGQPCDGNPSYVSLSRTRILTTDQRASNTAVLWLLIGTDSGFEGLTRLFYQSVHVKLEPL